MRLAGEMGRKIRDHAWSQTSLGPIEAWPRSLQAVVELMLASRHPAAIAWGPELSTLYNEAMIPIFGITRTVDIGTPFEKLWGTVWDELEPQVAATLRGEPQYFVDRPLPLEWRKQAPVGWFTFSWTPMRDDAEEVRGFFIVVTETTESVRAAAAQAQRYRTLFDSIDEGFCVIQVEFDGDRPVDYRFLEVNPAFEAHTGLAAPTGRRMRELVPAHEQQWFETYGRVARTGIAVRFVQHAAAMGRWFNVYAFRIGAPDENLVALLFADVTQRRRIEDALLAADRRKDEFLATLAHELRNPLAPLRNGIELLLGETATAPARRTVDMMKRQLAHLVRLVDDLLDVGRIRTGKLTLRTESVDLRDVIEASIEATRASIESRRHTLEIRAPESLEVRGDFDRLAQVISNLLSNAAKYSEPGGHIELSIVRENDEAVIEVRDRGIGIPPSELARVFDLFSQVRAHQGYTGGGLGIGLSLVRSLVEMHGGRVEARNNPAGPGSTFSVRLPLKAVGEASHYLEPARHDARPN
jgi:PAS domain S-box-containing protein